jgi:hypothetical protein
VCEFRSQIETPELHLQLKFYFSTFTFLFERSRAKTEGRKNSTPTPTTNFVRLKLFTFLSKFLTFLSLFQPPKTFPHVLNYPNLSKRQSEKIFSSIIFFHFFYFLLFFCPLLAASRLRYDFQRATYHTSTLLR